MSLPLDVPVFAANGDLIGSVADVRGDEFKVETQKRDGYWLSGRCVETVSVAGVYLSVREDHLEPYKLSPVGVGNQRGEPS